MQYSGSCDSQSYLIRRWEVYQIKWCLLILYKSRERVCVTLGMWEEQSTNSVRDLVTEIIEDFNFTNIIENWGSRGGL